jgi:hypothetical protein
VFITKEGAYMEPCLIDDKVCSEQHLRCKECHLNDCKRVIEMIETQEQRIRKMQEENIRKCLPPRCRDCRFLEFIDIRNKKLYCPYKIKDCLIK